MLISNIPPNVKDNEFYKHKGTRNTKLCLFFYFLRACLNFIQILSFGQQRPRNAFEKI